MIKPVEYYISELLFLHDCVIIPNFGGFVSNKQSAKLNRVNGVLSPPTKQILFNKNLTTNDGLLISHIANQEAISNKKAQDITNNFSNEINERLESLKILRINKIGLFTLGSENNVTFVQDNYINYSLDAFGMESVKSKILTRKTAVEKDVDTTIKTIRNASIKTYRRTILRAAAVLLPLFTLSYVSIYQQEKINSIYTEMANLNIFSIITEYVKPTIKEKTETEILKHTNESSIVAKPKIIETQIIATKHYIIAGSFKEQNNANKMVEKLQRWGYNTEIIDGNGLLRVSYLSFENRDNAVLALNKIKNENPAAWLLSK